MSAISRTLSIGLVAGCLPSTALACTLCLCSLVATTPVAFANYDPGVFTATDVVGQLTLSCTVVSVSSTIAYEIRLGRGTANSYAPRRMSGPAGSGLNYNLYTTAARTIVWGDGTGGSSVVSGSGTVLLVGGLARTHSVFGRVPARQFVQAGAYTDLIVVTVAF